MGCMTNIIKCKYHWVQITQWYCRNVVNAWYPIYSQYQYQFAAASEQLAAKLRLNTWCNQLPCQFDLVSQTYRLSKYSICLILSHQQHRIILLLTHQTILADDSSPSGMTFWLSAGDSNLTQLWTASKVTFSTGTSPHSWFLFPPFCSLLC